MNEANTVNNSPIQPRILSIDALRGFDMIWILGAETIFASLFVLSGWSVFSDLSQQMQHSKWHGLTAYDVIFPLFIFLSGISIGLSAKPLNIYDKQQQTALKGKAVKRLLLLCGLGVLYNHGWGIGVPASFDEVRYASVLGRIAIAGFIATLCVWYLSDKYQWGLAIGILVGYWLLLTFVNIGGYGAGDFSANKALNAWFDLNVLPGVRYQNLAIDPEGILSNIPSVVNAMLGVFVGKYIKKERHRPYLLLKNLSLIAMILLIVGYAWSVCFPINKTLWTSSFVLVTVGYSLLTLVVFYGVIDVFKWQTLGRFFSVIGVNSILIYLMTSLVHWRYTTESLVGGLFSVFEEDLQSLFFILTMIFLQWLFLYWLYKRNIFIKV